MNDLYFHQDNVALDDHDRYLTRRYTPGSIGPSTASPIGTIVNSTLTFALLTGQRGNVSTSLIANSGNELLSLAEFAIFLGSTTDNRNLLPGGSNINHNQWALIGPLGTPYSFGGTEDDIAHASVRVGIINVSAPTTTITVKTSFKYIINEGGISE